MIYTNNAWFQVNEHSSRDVLSSAGFTEESVEGIVSTADGLVTGHLTVGLDSMLQTVQFPTTVSNLNSGLANVDWNHLTLGVKHARMKNDCIILWEERRFISILQSQLTYHFVLYWVNRIVSKYFALRLGLLLISNGGDGATAKTQMERRMTCTCLCWLLLLRHSFHNNILVPSHSRTLMACHF